jgi:hypothetical protein
MSKIEIELAGRVEYFMGCEVVGESSGKAHSIPDFRLIIPNRCAGALP